MNIAKENIDQMNAVIRLTIEKADYETRVSDVLNDHRKKVQMPGFRPGKVPASLVNKMYGKAVLVDEINKLVSENLSNYLVESKLNILGEPLPSDQQTQIDFDTQETFEFVFDIAVAPEIEVKLSQKDKLPYYSLLITDEMLEQQIKSVTGRLGKNEQVEKVTEKSMVKGNFCQLDENGNEVEGGIRTENTVISMAIVKDENEKQKLMGASVGDVLVFNPKVAFPNDTEISYMLKITKEEASALNSNFSFTIVEATEFVNAELTQELFTQLYGEGVVNSEEEFKAKVKEELQSTLAFESDYRFIIDARTKLTEKFNMELPEAFLLRWVKATNKGEKDGLTDEQIDAEMPKFIEDLKWQLIKNKLIEENEIKIEQSDLLANAKKAARMQFMQYGLSNIPEDYLESYAVDMLNKEQQRRQFADGAMNDKVMKFIKDAVKLDEKEVTREEFNQLFEKN
jgi:trigger factor